MLDIEKLHILVKKKIQILTDFDAVASSASNTASIRQEVGDFGVSQIVVIVVSSEEGFTQDKSVSMAH